MGCKSERIPRTGLIFTILINHAPSQELVIYSEVIMSCFNNSLTESLILSTQQLRQVAPASTARSRSSLVPPPDGPGNAYEKGLSPSNPLTEIPILLRGLGPEPCPPDSQPINAQAKGPYHRFPLGAKARILPTAP